MLLAYGCVVRQDPDVVVAGVWLGKSNFCR